KTAKAQWISQGSEIPMTVRDPLGLGRLFILFLFPFVFEIYTPWSLGSSPVHLPLIDLGVADNPNTFIVLKLAYAFGLLCMLGEKFLILGAILAAVSSA